MRRLLTVLGLVALSGPALAQVVHAPPASTPAPAAPAAPEPQRTTATFGDWLLRCVRPEHAPAMCEVAQILYDKGNAVAQTVIGRPAHDQPLRLTALLPVNVNLTAPVRFLPPEGETGSPTLDLAWRRCMSTGCIADIPLTDEQLRRIRSRTENARLMFQDAAGREVTMPFGPKGLPQALDALAKEDQPATAQAR